MLWVVWRAEDEEGVHCCEDGVEFFGEKCRGIGGLEGLVE